MQKLTDIDLNGKRVLIRVDYNVPMQEGRVQNDFRIRASMPTIKHCLNSGASVVLMSHLGRPNGEFDDDLSLDPIAFDVEDLLDIDVHFSKDCISKESIELSHSLKPGEVHLLENLRFHNTETDNDDVFSLLLAQHGDVYVNDAFGTAHRAHASNVGVTQHIEAVAPGFLMEKEWKYLSAGLDKPEQPYMVILGGAKVAGKIELIHNLMEKADTILIGGAMAFTFLKAQGKNIGASLVDEDNLAVAEEILNIAKTKNVRIELPVDVVCATGMADETPWRVANLDEMKPKEMGFDIGPETCMNFEMLLSMAKTVVWNGPLGVTEIQSFATGTQAVASAVKNLTKMGVTTIIGGGDTAAAIEEMGFKDGYSHVSTGGGASLEILSGKSLPAFEALNDK
ncbi:MAG: phosphoglycerate kinase [Candidatus Marinimicrobia bacterium]|nr:phosphoglycerate kinase [Candidatus Neomarinimicrobiota bacterium]